MHRHLRSGARAPLIAPHARLGAVLGLLVAGLVLAGAVSAPQAAAQERDVVFHQVTVSSAEASIALEFADGERLTVTLSDGQVLVNEAEVGRYEAGSPLEASWRALLREAVALENAELARLLAGWSPPSGLAAEAARTAGSLTTRLQDALVPPTPPTPPRVEAVDSDLEDLMQNLLLRSERLRALPEALRSLQPERMRVYMGGESTVAADDTLEATLLVLDGHLRVDGRLDGDILLMGGTVTLGEDAEVTGDIRWLDGQVAGNRDAVRGAIQEIQPVPDRPEADLRAEIRREVEAALAPVRQMQRPARTGFQPPGAVRNVVEGIARLFQTLVTFAVLFALGLALLYFVPRNFEVVARTARHAPGRSALVGLAGGVLAFPVWILGIVLFAITIIGIPVMLVWLPIFPMAVALAMVVGYVAVARNVGRWMSERPIQGFDALEDSRPAVQLGMGLALLLAAFAMAGVFQMGGAWLGAFKVLVFILGMLVTVGVVAVGFGAVILSHAGRDPLYAGPDWTYAGERDPFAPAGRPFRRREPADTAAEAEPEMDSPFDEPYGRPGEPPEGADAEDMPREHPPEDMPREHPPEDSSDDDDAPGPAPGDTPEGRPDDRPGDRPEDVDER